FLRFAALDPAGDQARDFVLLEDWLNEGAPLPGPMTRDCLVGWYGENRPATGGWTIAGTVVRPRDLNVPTLVVVPMQDRIVPPLSAAALAGPDGVPGATRLDLPLGHIGMMVGSGAAKRCWAPLIDWLRAAAAKT
ncbi:MAG: alpha/beta hydrolase, partial [Rhodospirillales bacterium]|nr:alpha/beta hydrolase [Rhodospirillales bacterium]